MYNFIFFDGSISSMGNLLWAVRQTKRVWIVLSNDTPHLINIVRNVHDCGGSLQHFENGNRIPHISYNIKGIQFVSLLNPEDMFFSIVSDMHEHLQEDILSKTKICLGNCNDGACGTCRNCTLCNGLSNEYGMYDILDMTYLEYQPSD